MNYIEYIDDTPVEAKWFRLEFPFPPSQGLYKWRASTIRMNRTKSFLTSLGYRINIDFKIDRNYYSDKVVVFLTPEIESHASLIMLKWNPPSYE